MNWMFEKDTTHISANISNQTANYKKRQVDSSCQWRHGVLELGDGKGREWKGKGVRGWKVV